MQEGAEMADITPREFCDMIVGRFKNQAGANAPYDIVIRTSSPALAEAIKCIWHRMEDSVTSMSESIGDGTPSEWHGLSCGSRIELEAADLCREAEIRGMDRRNKLPLAPLNPRPTAL
ncbi:hypothetical protein L873DRAFT_1810751, partial [Choiromyces venosus 120613-1]